MPKSKYFIHKLSTYYIFYVFVVPTSPTCSRFLSPYIPMEGVRGWLFAGWKPALHRLYSLTNFTVRVSPANLNRT